MSIPRKDNPKTDLFVVTDFLTMTEIFRLAEGASSDLQSNANPMSMSIQRQCQSYANSMPI